jgi:hypothetical protein
MNLKVEGSFDEQQEAQGTQQENKTIPSGNAHLSTHTYQSTTNNHNRQGAYIQCSATINSNMIMPTCKDMLEI